MPRRVFVYTSSVLFFLSMASTVATSRPAHGQDGTRPMPAAEPTTVKPSQTFVQIDGASLISAFAAAGALIAAGIRSAAGVVTRYMAAQEGKSEARELVHAQTVKTLAEIVAKYYADRNAATEAIEEFGEDLEELKEQIAGDVGRVKPRRRPRRRPPPLPSEDHQAGDHNGDHDGAASSPPPPVSNL